MLCKDCDYCDTDDQYCMKYQGWVNPFEINDYCDRGNRVINNEL
jgi:hypothetical protein